MSCRPRWPPGSPASTAPCIRRAGEPGGPNVWLFVGVNGVGKTTTIGKVGKRSRSADGRRS